MSPPVRRYQAELAGGAPPRSLEVETLEGGRLRVALDGVERLIDARRVGDATYSLLIEGRAHLIDVEGTLPALSVGVGGEPIAVRLTDPRREALAQAGRAAAAARTVGPATLASPMPGKVVKVLIAAGDAVQAGQGLVVVEAMKMENELRSPRAGTVTELRVREGQPVEAGERLAVIA